MAKTNAEKQDDLRRRREKMGLKRKEYWATEAHHKILKQTLRKLIRKKDTFK